MTVRAHTTRLHDGAMKRLMIYDLDGTLVDTGEDIVQSVNHMLGQLDRGSMAREAVIRCIGRGLRVLVASCLKTDDSESIEEGMRIYRAHYKTHLLDHTVLYPSAKRLLEQFKDRTQAVLTNKPNPFTQEILRGLGVAGYFVEVIAGNGGYPRKPDPTAVRALMEKNHMAAHDVVMVGDSPIDVETGRNAGVLTVAVTHGFGDAAELVSSAPDAMVRNLDELIDLAARQGW